MEQPSISTNEQQPSFEERLSDFLIQGHTEIETAEIDTKEKVVAHGQINLLEQHLPNALPLESKVFLTSLSGEDFKLLIPSIFRHFTGNKNFSLENLPQFSVDNLKNLLLSRKVYGYGHPDLEEREKSNPLPTAQEVLLGCYVEQIEEQTREAVLVLREKGYQTVESGYGNDLTGSQFFHLEEKIPTTVSDELISKIKELFQVSVTCEHHGRSNGRTITYLTFNPGSFKTLPQWKECLDFFAEQMPVVGEETFSTVGGALYFWEHIKERFPLESILPTARNQHEEELIRKLYACKNKKEIVALVKGN